MARTSAKKVINDKRMIRSRSIDPSAFERTYPGDPAAVHDALLKDQELQFFISVGTPAGKKICNTILA
jgi:hypothetical protein